MSRYNFNTFLEELLLDRSVDAAHAFPCSVDSYDQSTTTASVTPLASVNNPDGTAVPFQQITNVPVAFSGGAGYFSRFPLQQGDIVLCVFSSWDIDEVMQSGATAPVKKGGMHNAFIIGRVQTQSAPPLPASSETGIVIGEDSQNGMYLSIDKDAKKFKFCFDSQNYTEISASGVRVVLNGLGVDLYTHTHNYVDTPVGPSVTNPPTAM